MAGRPKAMAKRLAELEETLYRVAAEVCSLRPATHAAERQNAATDEIGQFWNGACRTLEAASVTLAVLLYLLEERAGLDAETLQQERERRRGLLSEEADAAETREGVS